jgi:hypothetical protein
MQLQGAEKRVVSIVKQHAARPLMGLLAHIFALLLLAGLADAQPVLPTSRIDIATAPAVLVMIGDPGCPYCARFEREVAPGYVASEDGKLAPLVRRDRRDADVAFIERVVFSPTFVMLMHGREVGRIVGYSGADLFWMQIAALIEDVRIALKRSGTLAPDFTEKSIEWTHTALAFRE